VIIFTSSPYHKRFVKPFRAAAQDARAGSSEIKRFPNGELYVHIKTDVNQQDCLVIGSISPPDENLLAVLALVDALKHGGARSVRVFLPYLAYARQDKFEKGSGGGIEFIGALLRASGVDEIVTIDVHSSLDQGLIGLPIRSLSAAPLFKDVIYELGWPDITIVAPDEGARTRSQAMADALGYEQPIAYLSKKRVDGIIHVSLTGNISSRAIVVDDIIDSGRTLVSCCNLLRERGVQDIAVVVTHGLFTGNAWKRLFGLGVSKLFVTDSCPEATAQHLPQIQVVPLTPQLAAVAPKTARKEKSDEHTYAQTYSSADSPYTN